MITPLQIPSSALIMVAGVAVGGLALAPAPSSPPSQVVEVELVSPPPPPARHHNDELTCCFGGCDHELHAARRPDDGRLTKGDIIWGMAQIKGQVYACYQGVPGLANVSVTIAADGHVSDASVSGSFSRTPTGECVERAVRHASFRAVKLPITINYPFMLR